MNDTFGRKITPGKLLLSVRGDTACRIYERASLPPGKGRGSTFLHLIPGTSSVHLDTPTTQLIVHGIPTSHALLTIGEELSTFNTGLILSQEPRWLTSNERREGKCASSIVISITGSKAPDIAKRPRLSAFSTTYRLERRLRFNHLTQCARCQHFGHHTLRS